MKNKIKNHKKKTTVFKKIFAPLLIIAIIQILFLYIIFEASGVIGTFDDNAKKLLSESTRNKYQMLQSKMVGDWTSFGIMEENINNLVEQELSRHGKSWKDINTNATLNSEITEKVTGELVERLRKSKATGIFLVLDGVAIDGDKDSYAGVYIRNRDPLTESTDNSDLGLLRGLPPISREFGFPLESFWQASFRFEGGRDNVNNDFFYKPLDAARNLGVQGSVNCAYWSHQFKLSGVNDISIITYSIPLFNEEGHAYGVIGIELETGYLISQIYTDKNLLNGKSYYIGITENNGNSYEKVACTDTKYDLVEVEVKEKFTNEAQEFITTNNSRNGNSKLYGAVFPLRLYNNFTPYVDEQWVLIGFQDQGTLLASGRNFKQLLFFALGLILLLDIVVALLSTYGIIRPITNLAKAIEKKKEYEEFEYPYTKVAEIDALSNSISDMNHRIINSAKRTSKLFELSGLPIGVYEKKTGQDLCYCSDGFFEILDCEKLKNDNNILPIEQLNKIIAHITKDKVSEDIYKILIKSKLRYIRIITQEDEIGVVGSILDVTKEMEERRKIEYDRDYDVLTGILNRRAFEYKMGELFEHNQAALGIAAMVMFDLDNLKAMNDTYGHDYGDLYISTFAKILEGFQSEKCLVARRSGDEFYMFMYGYESKQEVIDKMKEYWEIIGKGKVKVLYGNICKIRVSAGYSWYPQDETVPQKLVHYADFAMYQAKQTRKGTIMQFDIKQYEQDAILFNGHDALNRLIEQQLVQFMFQPIISAKTGRIYGYELLMRSKIEEFKSPVEILRVAKAQGKLNHIEKITWQKALEAAENAIRNGVIASDSKLFINSIANQVLSKEDIKYIKNQYKELLSDIVLEVTEGEDNELDYTKQKIALVNTFGGQVAIDDYGTGYNSELALVMIPAQIVKIDISFVRNVDTDISKQALIKNLISFAKSKNIAVLAEGVETKEECKTLIAYGVDYLQGYYIAKPQYVPVLNDNILEGIS